MSVTSNSPICLTCCREMRPKRNGVYFIEVYDDGVSPELTPYRIWNSDHWRCPVCEAAVLSGHGRPISAASLSPEELKNIFEGEEGVDYIIEDY